jgi:hypothetical protein
MRAIKNTIEFLQAIAYLCGYRTEAEKEYERQANERSRKHAEATQTMIDLYGRYQTMSVSEILDELERMHAFFAVAIWAPGFNPPPPAKASDRGMYFFEITLKIYREATGCHVDRLVEMLRWKEFYDYQDRSAPGCFLFVTEKYPDPKYIAPLTEHLAWLTQEEKQELYSHGLTHRHADIASEAKATQHVIELCRTQHVAC